MYRRNLRWLLSYRWLKWSRRCLRRSKRSGLHFIVPACAVKYAIVHQRCTSDMPSYARFSSSTVWAAEPARDQYSPAHRVHLALNEWIRPTEILANKGKVSEQRPPLVATHEQRETAASERVRTPASDAAKLGVAARQSGSSLPESSGAIFEGSPTSRPVLPQTRSCRCLSARESFSRREHPFSPVSTGQHPWSAPVVPVKTSRWTGAGQIESCKHVQRSFSSSSPNAIAARANN